jgi:hypothetical protein
MSLRLSRLPCSIPSIFPFAAAGFLLLGACTNPAVIADATGGKGGGSHTTATTGTGGGSTTGTGGGNACTAAGGKCEPITPNFCVGGTAGDASKYPCGGVGVGCCLPSPCADSCTTPGATRCVAGAVETCEDNPDDTACGLTWIPTAACPSGQGCSSDGSKCIAPATTCTTSADCGCGCGCGGGMCHCTGGIPPSCNQASDCGPSCAGIACVSQKCVPPACTPGEDFTCNDDVTMQALAGKCTLARTCVCNMGFVLKPDGKCGL